MSSEGAIVSMRDVGRVFGGREVLAEVSVEVFAGEVVGIIGPNGGGKSTLLRLMAGLVKPTSGDVSVCGTPAQKLALQSAGLVGLVLARPGLYPLLTGWENLLYFAGLFGLSAAEARSKAAPLLERLALGPQMNERVGAWSTGMQQKLSLVRALLLEPKLLLFDEPTANLDPIAAESLYEEVRHRADEGLACVLVTHHLAAAEAICDRVWLVQGGIREEIEVERKSAPAAGPLMDAWHAMETR